MTFRDESSENFYNCSDHAHVAITFRFKISHVKTLYKKILNYAVVDFDEIKEKVRMKPFKPVRFTNIGNLRNEMYEYIDCLLKNSLLKKTRYRQYLQLRITSSTSELKQNFKPKKKTERSLEKPTNYKKFQVLRLKNL